MIEREVCGECDKYVRQEASCENQSKQSTCQNNTLENFHLYV